MSTTTGTSHCIRSRSVCERSSTRWLAVFFLVYGLWVLLPFLAPVFMHFSWSSAGKAIYFLYSFFCHQLPERSFFLFGEKSMYSLCEIQAACQDTINPLILRKFIGNEAMGWKVAWSDRMISFYTSIWLFANPWTRFRRINRPLAWWKFVLLLLPLIIDGISHAISDLSGIGQGFRDTNQWLAVLTSNFFFASLYIGDAFSSFNSIARFITGSIAGFGLVWFAFPYLEDSFGKNESKNKDHFGG